MQTTHQKQDRVRQEVSSWVDQLLNLQFLQSANEQPQDGQVEHEEATGVVEKSLNNNSTYRGF